MASLIFASCLALSLAVLPVLSADRAARQLEGADEQRLRDVRTTLESHWVDWWLATWSFLTAVGATFAIARGHHIGWAWLVVAAVYGCAIVTNRRFRSRLREELGDRGRVERHSVYKKRRASAARWLVVAATGFVGTHVVDDAYPHHMPDGALVLKALCGLVMVVGAIGALVVRTRGYLAGDDLRDPDEQPSDS